GRIDERLDELYAIGAGTRRGYSPEEDAAHELASGWMREAGLETEVDEAGNLIGRRGSPRVWSGSHLDTVPDGGKFDGALGVVGVEPNAPNVVPARVTVSVDARAPEAGQLDELVAAIGFEPTSRIDPVAMSGAPFAVLSELLPDAPRLVSGAGHDAMVLAAAGVPTAMLFVRSLNGGVSHCPEELSSLEDIELAVDALTAALGQLSHSDTSGV